MVKSNSNVVQATASSLNTSSFRIAGMARSYIRNARRVLPNRLLTAVLVTAVFLFSALALHAAWIPLKAELAQWLIARSWEQAQTGAAAPPPWPWADTRPVAELEVPDKGIRQFVLEGNSGRNLAFGPVFTDGTAHGRDRVINGHRDTHFDFLQLLAAGDQVRLETPSEVQWFEVVQTDVIDSRVQEMLIDPGRDRLSLVTCYPFDSPDAGGPLRYVVTALPADSP